jgi:hypothetical protein
MKQGSIEAFCEEALVIFVWALDFNPNFTLVVMLSEIRKKASVNSEIVKFYALFTCDCVGNLV